MSPSSYHTESQPEMEFEDFINSSWTRTRVYLPLTTLVTFWVCCVVRREQASVIYYMNLLISNLTQFILLIFLKHGHHYLIIDAIFISLIVSLYFRMSIAMERCFVITRPQSNCIRQTGTSMLVSVLIWILCISTLTLSIVFTQIIPLFVLALLPAPLFIFFPAWTFKALPAATSVPTDEKRRIVGTLVLLFINYFLMILPIIIYIIVNILSFYKVPVAVIYTSFALFLLSPFADLILVVFMQKGSIDKLLSCLRCCITDDTAEDVAGHQQLHELMLQREKVNQTV